MAKRNLPDTGNSISALEAQAYADEHRRQHPAPAGAGQEPLGYTESPSDLGIGASRQQVQAAVDAARQQAAAAAPSAPPPAPSSPSSPAPSPTAPAAPSPLQPQGLNFDTAQAIIDSALQLVGLDPNEVAAGGVDAGMTLTQYYWKMITSEGLTDPTTIGDMITTTIAGTGQFQKAFPGYQQALKNGYVRTPADYVTAESSDTAIMMNYGIPQEMINPSTIGNIIAGGVSSAELTSRLQNGYDAALNAPAEVQNVFQKWFGAQGPNALATLFITPPDQGGQTWPTLEKMLGAAQIAGAGAASNLTVSQGLAQRLADMGETYSSARSKFQQLTAQAGLYDQTVGEANKTPVAGAANGSQPLTESNQGVGAAFGLSAQDQQQVENAILTRENAFRGGGGATQTQQEGYTGIGPAKAF